MSTKHGHTIAQPIVSVILNYLPYHCNGPKGKGLVDKSNKLHLIPKTYMDGSTEVVSTSYPLYVCVSLSLDVRFHSACYEYFIAID